MSGWISHSVPHSPLPSSLSIISTVVPSWSTTAFLHHAVSPGDRPDTTLRSNLGFSFWSEKPTHLPGQWLPWTFLPSSVILGRLRCISMALQWCPPDSSPTTDAVEYAGVLWFPSPKKDFSPAYSQSSCWPNASLENTMQLNKSVIQQQWHELWRWFCLFILKFYLLIRDLLFCYSHWISNHHMPNFICRIGGNKLYFSHIFK